MLEIKEINCPKDKYPIKCPYNMTPTRIIIHNTANDASAENEIAYMHRNDKETSFHFAVDDKNIIQGLPLDRNSWNAGDGNGIGNREGISIEICYSKSGGKRFEEAQENAAELTAYLLKKYGFGIDKVTKHQDYSKRTCPHRTLSDYGWQYYLDLVKKYSGEAVPDNVKPGNNSNNIDVTYQTWDDVKNIWLPNVTNQTDYAGIFGHDVCAVYANLSKGNIIYAVHIKGGKWLPEVTNREDYAGLFNKPIDGIYMRTDTGKKINYKAHLRKSKRWLPVVNGSDIKDSEYGYAGILGQEIDGLQIWLE